MSVLDRSDGARYRNADAANRRALCTTQNQRVMFAWEQHDSSPPHAMPSIRGTYQVNFLSGDAAMLASSSMASLAVDMRAFHGTLMALCWALIIPAAVRMLRFLAEAVKMVDALLISAREAVVCFFGLRSDRALRARVAMVAHGAPPVGDHGHHRHDFDGEWHGARRLAGRWAGGKVDAWPRV